MKHNTHIYLAAKAIDLLKQSVDNTKKGDRYLQRGDKTKARRTATELQRILRYHKHFILEASWAPDDILHDNDPFHIFKLFTDAEFPNHGLDDRFLVDSGGVRYYRYGGGLPYRIDHIAQQIKAMALLREYNDQYTLRQMVYQYLLLSHYLADAHVPMHCDLRDDPPSDTSGSQPSRRRGSGKPAGEYMDKKAHAALEGVWDDAVTPVALKEGILPRSWVKEGVEETDLSDEVRFRLKDCLKGEDVKVKVIRSGGLMSFMVDVCLQSKRRGQQLFPLADPKTRNDQLLPEITRDIFADAIGNLMSVWLHIWNSWRD
ncbi:MAG: hypothetical protein QGH60_07745 [Phycisphaerae bacterium]|nr:hypothetical protein [Phycisphaerae bacterium]